MVADEDVDDGAFVDPQNNHTAGAPDLENNDYYQQSQDDADINDAGLTFPTL